MTETDWHTRNTDVLEQFTPRAAAKSPAPPAPAPAQAQVISSASSSIPTVPASSFPPPSPTPGSSFPQSAPTSTATSTWPAPPKADEEEDEEENDDFTRELQRGMEQLMRELCPVRPLVARPPPRSVQTRGARSRSRRRRPRSRPRGRRCSSRAWTGWSPRPRMPLPARRLASSLGMQALRGPLRLRRRRMGRARAQEGQEGLPGGHPRGGG
ncbi:hypothetical protein FIBSPDRAFT_334715 [Athelia psychrophila]|uniref:Uncharacterized protein n=1 Tax=Athelia psychrophila TaxID=1759441 RepID=A0A166Q6A7_9AGAM|nr:hypothetical protein FIBSPDRAFT_334715 [Fibularhizoctonia sp. CBS 109695]